MHYRVDGIIGYASSEAFDFVINDELLFRLSCCNVYLVCDSVCTQ